MILCEIDRKSPNGNSFVKSKDNRLKTGKENFNTLTCSGAGSYHVQGANVIMEVEQIGNLIEKSNYKNPHRGRCYSADGLSPTLTTMQGGGIVPKFHIHNGKKHRVRRLTPKECYRLMGFSDEDFKKAQKELSDTRLYSTAGNSIVVDVLMAIFKEML